MLLTQVGMPRLLQCVLWVSPPLLVLLGAFLYFPVAVMVGLLPTGLAALQGLGWHWLRSLAVLSTSSSLEPQLGTISCFPPPSLALAKPTLPGNLYLPSPIPSPVVTWTHIRLTLVSPPRL